MLGIRLPKKNPNPWKFDSRLGYSGGILDAFLKKIYINSYDRPGDFRQYILTRVEN